MCHFSACLQTSGEQKVTATDVLIPLGPKNEARVLQMLNKYLICEYVNKSCL